MDLWNHCCGSIEGPDLNALIQPSANSYLSHCHAIRHICHCCESSLFKAEFWICSFARIWTESQIFFPAPRTTGQFREPVRLSSVCSNVKTARRLIHPRTASDLEQNPTQVLRAPGFRSPGSSRKEISLFFCPACATYKNLFSQLPAKFSN